ncbi:sugar phosphate isomerase/epimerase [Micromonospora zingiberis]|uniref:Sugar phosphate isomerase/epimerase n=1 Tax=Micromonospora zingiberis TaxID=2053011 RepID=A0A4R0GIG8_9ACTN|nr:sugar phosphate isomerase/epimerase family protein [Micromonospora zingiberis]TCB97210.1 sugar phosphate isomerase/epimerase [Micromonospora zingiberis]
MTSSSVAAARLVLAWGTVRAASFPDRVWAAADAGFPSIGMAVPDYLALLKAGWTDERMSAVLTEHGVTIDEVEVIFGFCAPPGPANLPERPGLVYADPEIEAAAFRMADAFGARRVQAVGTFGDEPVGPQVAAAFTALCDRAAAHGLRVALEFVPYTNIPDLRTALDILTAAGRANGGLCVDAWHFFRGNADFDALAAVDPGDIFMIQVNDGPATPTTPNRMFDAVHHRRCPGEGDFDLERFLHLLDRPGLDAPISVEVYSDDLARLPSIDAARRAASTTQALLRRLPTTGTHAHQQGTGA